MPIAITQGFEERIQAETSPGEFPLFTPKATARDLRAGAEVVGAADRSLVLFGGEIGGALEKITIERFVAWLGDNGLGGGGEGGFTKEQIRAFFAEFFADIGLTEPQIQALIDTAVEHFISQTQIQALIDAAFADTEGATRAYAVDAYNKTDAIADFAAGEITENPLSGTNPDPGTDLIFTYFDADRQLIPRNEAGNEFRLNTIGQSQLRIYQRAPVYLGLNRQLRANESILFDSLSGLPTRLTAANFERLPITTFYTHQSGQQFPLAVFRTRTTLSFAGTQENPKLLRLQMLDSDFALRMRSYVEVGRDNLSAALKAELTAAGGGGTIDPAVFAAMAAAYFATRFSDEQVEALKAIAAEDFAGDITAINARIDGLDLGLDESQVSALIAAANANFLTATAISALIAAAGGGGVDRGVIVAASSVGEASEFASGITIEGAPTLPAYSSGRLLYQPINEGDSDIAEGIRVRGIDWESKRYWAIRGGGSVFAWENGSPTFFYFTTARYTLYISDESIFFGPPDDNSEASINAREDLYFAFLVDRTTGIGEYFINGVKIGESSQVNVSLVDDDFVVGNSENDARQIWTLDGQTWDIEVAGGDAAFDGAALSTAGIKFDDDERRVALIGRENAYFAKYAVDQTARNAAAAALTAAQNAGGGSGEDETARATATNALAIASENRAELERVIARQIDTIYSDSDDGDDLNIWLWTGAGQIGDSDAGGLVAIGAANGSISNSNSGAVFIVLSSPLAQGQFLRLTRDGETLARLSADDFTTDGVWAVARNERVRARATVFISGIVVFQLQAATIAHDYSLAERLRVNVSNLSPEILRLIHSTAAISLPAALVAAAEVFTANSSTATESTPYAGLVLIRAGEPTSSQNDYAVGNPENLFHGIMGRVSFALPNSAHFDPRFIRFFPPEDSQETDIEVADANAALNGFVVYTINLTRAFGVGGQLFGGTIRIDSLVASELFQVPAASIIESKDRAFLTRAQIAAFVEWGFVSKPDALLLHQFFQNARVVDVAVFNFAGEINPLFAGFAPDDNIPTTAAGRTAMNLALATDQAKTFGVSNRFPTPVVNSDDTGNWIDIDRFPAGSYAARMVVVDATFQSGFVGEGVLLLINSKAADKALCFIYQPDQSGGRIVARYPNADGDITETTIAENMAGTKKRLSFYFTTSVIDEGNLEFLISINGLGAGGRLVANIATADINFASLEVGFDGKKETIIVPDPLAADPLVPVNPSLRRPPTQADLGNRQVLIHSAFTSAGRGQKESASGLGRLDNANGDFLLGVVDSAPATRTRNWLLGERLGGDITQQIQGRLPDNRIFRTIYGHICTGWYVQHYGDDAHKGVYVILEGDAIASGAYRQDDDGNWLPRFGGGNITIYITGFELTSRQYRGEYVVSDNIKDVWVEENGGNPYTFIRGGIDNSIFAYDRELVAEGTNKSAFEWAFDRNDPIEASDRLVGDLDVITADDARLYSTRAAVWIHEYALATLDSDSNIAAKFSGISVRVWVTPEGGRVLELADGTFGEAAGARAVIDANGVRIFSAGNKFKGGTLEEIVMFERLDAASGDDFDTNNALNFSAVSDNGGLSGFKDAAIVFLLAEVAFGTSAPVSSHPFFVVRPVSIGDGEQVHDGTITVDGALSEYITITNDTITGSHDDHRFRRIRAYTFSAAA